MFFSSTFLDGGSTTTKDVKKKTYAGLQYTQRRVLLDATVFTLLY